MFYRYMKLSKAIPTTKSNAITVSRLTLEPLVANYGIPCRLLTENGPPFVSKFFVAIYSTLAEKSITTTECYTQTNGQAERFNTTPGLRLRYDVSDHQTDWNTYLLRLKYVYNVQIHRSVEVSPFSLALTRTPPGPATVAPRRTILATDNDMASPIYATPELIKRATDFRQKADKSLRLAQKGYKKDYDPGVRFAPNFRVLDYDFLDKTPLFRSAM